MEVRVNKSKAKFKNSSKAEHAQPTPMKRFKKQAEHLSYLATRQFNNNSVEHPAQIDYVQANKTMCNPK